MTTINDLITRAVRAARIRGSGESIDPDEAADGLAILQGMIYDLIVKPTVLTDVEVTAAYTAEENQRLFNPSSYAITYPTSIEDADVASGSRPPFNGAVVEETSTTTPTTKVYVGALRTWKTISSLALSDENPLGPMHDRDLVSLIAYGFHDQGYKIEPPPPALASAADRAQRNIRQRFRQTYRVYTDPLINAPWRRDLT
jgi:hypothetical protein